MVDFQLGAGGKGLRDIAERYAVLRALRSGQARFDCSHIQRQGAGEYRLISGLTPHALRFRIGFHQRHLLFAAPGKAHIVKRNGIDRKEAAGRAILRRHIGDSRAVRQRQRIESIAVEFNKLTHNAVFTQHLGDRQDQVRRGNAFTQLAAQLEANNVRDQHGNRLTEHGGFRFDTADAPAQNA